MKDNYVEENVFVFIFIHNLYPNVSMFYTMMQDQGFQNVT